MSTKKKKVGILDWFGPVQKKTKTQDGCSTSTTPQPPIDPSTHETETETQQDTRREKYHFNINVIPHDPGLRLNIFDYNPNVQDLVRREYVQRRPCQLVSHDFPRTMFGVKSHRFNPLWFNKTRMTMLEDTFVKNGFKGWNRPVAFDKHVGKFNSAHNQDREKYLLHQGMAIRGHDEIEESRVVVESFIGVVHVKGTTALILRDVIHSLLAEQSLSPSKIRRQGYDRASNMKENDLNYSLQRKDQDIVEAMSLVELTKERLQLIRNDGWETHLKLATSFCEKNGIEVPKMEDAYVP
nr:hypothetical protein [Tanacetum cinerariifolium]